MRARHLFHLVGGPSTGLQPVPLPVSARILGMRFAGYAAVFGRVDRGGDVVRAGAFARSLRRGAPVPLFWEHDARRPVGRIEYLREDRRGLRVIGRVTDARAAEMVRAGQGLSFGYRVRSVRGIAPREIIDVDLVEVSLVATPMQPAARVHVTTK